MAFDDLYTNQMPPRQMVCLYNSIIFDQEVLKDSVLGVYPVEYQHMNVIYITDQMYITHIHKCWLFICFNNETCC